MRAISLSGLAALAVIAGVCTAVPVVTAATTPAAATIAAVTTATKAVPAAHAPVMSGLSHIAPPASAARSALAPAATAAQDQLSDVACLHAGDCIAVGGNNVGDGGFGSPLFGRWNGSRWADGVPPLPHGAPGGELYSLSCKPGGCVAVGYYYASATSYHALAEFWNGSRWSLLRQPAVPSGASNFILSVVSCMSRASCVAVGTYVVGRNTYGLIETLSGGSWHAARAPSPSASYTAMASVDCPAAGTCDAVGTYLSRQNFYTLIDVLSGGHWKTVKSANPNTASGYQDVLQGVSCPATTDCVAVGTVGKQVGKNFLMTGFSESWSGSAWSLQKVTWPSGSHSALYEVSCPTTAYCVAVGGTGVYTGLNDGHAAAQVRNGTGWSQTSMPGDAAHQGSVLFGVDCLSAAYCVAVGDVGPIHVAGHGLTAFWNGASWKRVNTG